MVQTNSSPLDKALADHTLLDEFYGRVPPAPRRTPMRELISTLLSHRTTHADEELAYDRMLEAFGDWENVLHAPLEGLIHAIRTTRWPATQAPRIQDILGRIKAETGGSFALDFLADWPTERAMQWLTDMPGIGLKTASLVLLFNFRKPVLPVDAHVHRVMQRLGVIGPKVSVEKAHVVLLDLLKPELDPEELFNFHKHNYWHGQQICFFQRPNCPRCPLKGFCEYYQEHFGVPTPAALADTPAHWDSAAWGKPRTLPLWYAPRSPPGSVQLLRHVPLQCEVRVLRHLGKALALHHAGRRGGQFARPQAAGR